MKKFLFITTIFAISSFAAIAEVTQMQAHSLYLQAISEKSGSLEMTKKTEDAYFELEAKNPNIKNRIRLASLTALQAKYSSLFKRAGLVNDAIDKYNALEIEVASITDETILYEFHLFRGRTYIQLPSLFGKKDAGRQDIKEAIRILPRIETSREKPEINRLYLSYAVVLKDEGEDEKSREYANKALLSNTLQDEDIKLAEKLKK